MMRTLVGALVALFLLVGGLAAADKAAKNQMVKGTVKSVDVEKGVLVVSQKVKNEVVDRELDVSDAVEFVIKDGKETKEVSGKDGLALLTGKEGASVAVKCDKDVKPIKITVTLKKT